MKKSTTIIITDSGVKLGRKGDTIKVASGYAFNYLIPNNFAQLATKGKLKHSKMLQKVEQHKAAKTQIFAATIKKRIQYIPKISIYKTIGEKKQIFGKISEKEIINIMLNNANIKLEKKQIYLAEIKTIGTYTLNIQIFNGINLEFKLQVLPKDHQIHL
uniref:50S ribosomal protein L9, chloroplastic n=1 Tax=Mastocarpus papillatus TaxID=31436 RepID=A0A342RZD6_9FLOR|nr:ribosomal protein L9 [Mastocarpus papillatus]AOL58082.1 ribosomal protein L9 [Mastocarpus papillatus]